MVGDDLLADIKGGQNAGLDTCWFNLKNEENKSNIHPKFEIGSYEDLYKIVMEPEELENIGVRNRRHSNEAVNCPAAYAVCRCLSPRAAAAL